MGIGADNRLNLVSKELTGAGESGNKERIGNNLERENKKDHKEEQPVHCWQNG